jgi:hypothetical protein
MSGTSPARAIASNEARALLPMFIACVTAAAFAALAGGDARQFSRMAYLAALVGLGAQSIGHEYGDRTLGLTLTLPVSRRRLFLVKLAVLAAMAVPAAAGASLLRLFTEEPALPWLAAAVSLCIAPSLTMLCRGQLAGFIFSLSAPGTALVATMIATGTPLDAPAPLAVWKRLMIVLLAAGAVAGWRLFMRLEAIEGVATLIRVGWWSATPRSVEPRHQIWQLVKKELRVQQMTFVITAMYLAACAAIHIVHPPMLRGRVSFVGAVSVIYELGLAVLAGSLASAEERHLGTLAWQLQLPMPAWQQWAVKVATVFGVTLLLSIGVPVLLVPALWPAEAPLIEMPIVLAVVMTAVSMYVSSISASAVRAVVTSAVAVSFILWLVVAPELWTARYSGPAAWLSAGAALLVAFAFVNHRPEPPPAARIWRQTLAVAALIGAGAAVVEIARF